MNSESNKMAMDNQAQSIIQELLYPEPSILDSVIEATQKRQPPSLLDYVIEATIEIPVGYFLLPAGTLRQIRVNQNFIKNNDTRPYIVFIPGVGSYCYTDIQIVGQVKLKTEKTPAYGCRVGSNSVWIETMDALLVKS